MTISRDLFLATLSLDVYSQGYGERIEHGKAIIGSAKVQDVPTDLDTSSPPYDCCGVPRKLTLIHNISVVNARSINADGPMR